MNHLNSIYQRLQSNYSDCDITYAPGLLTVKCKNGEIRTRFHRHSKTSQSTCRICRMGLNRLWEGPLRARR